jgi:hypothetical protein
MRTGRLTLGSLTAAPTGPKAPNRPGARDCLDAGRDFLAAAGVSGVLHTKLDFSLVARRNRRETVDLTAALHDWTGGSNSTIAWVTKKNGSRCESYNCKLPGLCRFE